MMHHHTNSPPKSHGRYSARCVPTIEPAWKKTARPYIQIHTAVVLEVLVQSQKRGKNEMKSRFLIALCAFVLVGISTVAAPQDSMSMKQDSMTMKQDPMVGGAAMYPTKDIVDNAINSADHTTLVAAVKAAGLVDTLKGPGPFTVFAPTNEA